MSLNEFQREAVDHVDGYCMVTSVPGSGKTYVLVERTVRLIERGIDPKGLLCITFTNKAANEMKERICKRLNIDTPAFFIGTFHALCSLLLRKLGHHIGYSDKFTILDSDDQSDLISQLGRKAALELTRGKVWKIAKAVNDFRENMKKDDFWEEETELSPEEINLGKAYIESIRKNNMLDFSGLLSEVVRLMETHTESRERIQNKFRYVQVDEFQDTNKIQFHLVDLFSGKHKNVFVVGDVNQSIFGFRGARWQNIRDFMDNHTGCKQIHLSDNYRSTPQIIEPADKLIRFNASFLGGDFVTPNAPGDKVKVLDFQDQYQEADWVAYQIQQHIKAGQSPRDIVILYRMNKMSDPIEQSLSRKGIQYEVVGSRSFYDRKEIRDCLALMKFYVNPKDGVAFHRVCGLLKGLGDVNVGRVENIAQEENVDLLEASGRMVQRTNYVAVKKACEKMQTTFQSIKGMSSPADCLTTLINKFEVEDLLTKQFPDDARDRIENVHQMIESVGQYAKNGKSVEQFLQMVCLITSSDKEVKDDAVTLMTLHAAKGLEFGTVFMVGVEKNILPHVLALQEDEEGDEGERRLCYVGITRAKKKLYMSYCNWRTQFTKDRGMRPWKTGASKFLVEAGLIDE